MPHRRKEVTFPERTSASHEAAMTEPLAVEKGGKVMRRLKITTMAIMLLYGAGTLTAGEMKKVTKVVQPTLTVKSVSPCGSVLKADMTLCHGGKKTLTFYTCTGGCPKVAAALKEKVRKLKKGSDVTVTYFKCPKSGKLIVTQVEQENSGKKCGTE